LGQIALPKTKPNMKAIKFTYVLVLAVAISFAATGCRNKPVGVTNIPGQRSGTPGGEELTTLTRGEPVQADEIGVPLPKFPPDLESIYNFDRETLRPHMVHFDFDSHVVKASEKPKVAAVAAYMKGQPENIALLIEGHCDERGTEEYNRSLGERRALALRETLILELGVDGNRVTTRSHGEDVPLDRGKTEAAYAKNRRGEFVVLIPK
jgi:peptidoglycan-associated lipoprotein